MTDISISLSGMTGVDWPRWQRLATEVEALGFAGLYRDGGAALVGGICAAAFCRIDTA